MTTTIAFYAGVALIDAGCGSTDSNWCNGVSLLEYAVRSLIMLSTVVAINFNITHIRFCIQVHRCSREKNGLCVCSSICHLFATPPCCYSSGIHGTPHDVLLFHVFGGKMNARLSQTAAPIFFGESSLSKMRVVVPCVVPLGKIIFTISVSRCPVVGFVLAPMDQQQCP